MKGWEFKRDIPPIVACKEERRRAVWEWGKLNRTGKKGAKLIKAKVGFERFYFGTALRV